MGADGPQVETFMPNIFQEIFQKHATIPRSLYIWGMSGKLTNCTSAGTRRKERIETGEGTMFKKLIGALVGLAMMGMAGSANATLIGDDVTFEGFFPNLGTKIAGPVITTVVAGTTDEFVLGVSTTNVESGSVIFTLSTGFTTGVDCNCIQITSMDWVDDPNGIISGITLS